MPNPEPDSWWETILWREWCHGDDDELAARIYAELAPRRLSEADSRRLGSLVMLSPTVASVVALASAAVFWLGGCLLLGWRRSGEIALFMPAAAVSSLLVSVPMAVRATRRVLREKAHTWHEVLSLLGPSDRGARSAHSGASADWQSLQSAPFADGMSRPMLSRALRRRIAWWIEGRPGEAELRQALSHPDAPAWMKELAAREGPVRSVQRLVVPDRLEVAPPATEEELNAMAGLPVLELLRKLPSSDAGVRTRAMNLLLQAGSAVIPVLLQADRAAMVPTEWSVRLLRSIATNSISQTPGDPAQWVCPRCYARLTTRAARLRTGHRETFHACRACGRYEGALLHPGTIVAVLDASDVRESWLEGEKLCVNWLTLAHSNDFEGQCLFDFDEVAIRSASDDQVKHFLVDVTSDTDTQRRKRYRTMPVALAPDVALSPNTLMALRNAFAAVEA